MAKRAKKRVKKKSSIKKTRAPRKAVSSQTVEIKMQPILVENFIALQKVIINLSTKFENLNQKLTKLLDLFELSAKTLAKKDFKFAQGNNEEVVEKLNELTEQNKVLAKGLTMIHEDEQKQPQIITTAPVVPRELVPPKPMPVKPKPLPKPTTTFPKQSPEEGEEYMKSSPSNESTQ